MKATKILLFFIISISFSFNQKIEIAKNSSEQKTLTFVSSNYDIEGKTRILETVYVKSYHIFDLKNKTITLKIVKNNGQIEKKVYNFSGSKTITSLSGNKSIEYYIKNDSCNLIWMDAINSIGYEFDSGKKWVFYDVKMI